MQSEGMLSLRCVDTSGKPVFELSSTSLISLYAFVLAHLRQHHSDDYGGNEDSFDDMIQIEWEYVHYLRDEDHGVCAQWRVFRSDERTKLYSGIIRRSPRTSSADFSVSSSHALFTSHDFLKLADRIHIELMNRSCGDIDIARSTMLFAAQMTDHPFWVSLKE